MILRYYRETRACGLGPPDDLHAAVRVDQDRLAQRAEQAVDDGRVIRFDPCREIVEVILHRTQELSAQIGAALVLLDLVLNVLNLSRNLRQLFCGFCLTVEAALESILDTLAPFGQFVERCPVMFLRLIPSRFSRLRLVGGQLGSELARNEVYA